MIKKLYSVQEGTWFPTIWRFIFWSVLLCVAGLGIAGYFVEPDVLEAFLTNLLHQIEQSTGLAISNKTMEILVAIAPATCFGIAAFIGFFAWKKARNYRIRRDLLKPSSGRIERALAGSDVPVDATSRGVNPDLVGKTVLIADDNVDVVQALSIRLKKLGITPFRSPDATHALLGVQKMNPDLVIMDVKMPSGDGLAVCEMLASDPKYARIPVIVYTGLSDKKTITRCRDVNAYYVLKSENAWEELEPLITNLLGTSHSQHGEESGSQADKSDSSETDEDQENPNNEKLVLLSIDSKGGVTRNHAKELIPHGIEAVRATDVERAYLKCFSKNPDAVLLSSDLPNIAPQEAVSRLRAHPFLKNTPIFVIGNQLTSEMQEQLTELKVVAFLEEPFDIESFLTELSKHPDFKENIPPNVLDETVPDADADEEKSLSTSIPEPQTEILPEDIPEDISKAEEDQKELSTVVDPNAIDEEDVMPKRARPKVLCIDDDPDVARSLSVRLRPYGIDVIPAYSGMQGFWTSVDMRPDVVVCDLKMPEGEGTYIFGRLQAHPLTKDVPVIILTGETNAGVKRLMMGMGASAYLTKPWDFRELLNELGRHIDLRSPTEQVLPAPV